MYSISLAILTESIIAQALATAPAKSSATADYLSIQPNTAQNTAGSLQEKFQPYYKIHSGCQIFSAFDHAGVQASVSNLDAPCDEVPFGANTYVRTWYSRDGTIGLMYTNFYPKLHLNPSIRVKNRYNHIYHWDVFAMSLHNSRSPAPFACTLQGAEDWIVLKGEQCFHSGKTVIRIADNDMSVIAVDPLQSDRRKLVDYGLLPFPQQQTFDKAHWEFAICYMSTPGFDDYMSFLYDLVAEHQ